MKTLILLVDVEVSRNLQDCSGINKETVSGQVVLKESPETPMVTDQSTLVVLLSHVWW